MKQLKRYMINAEVELITWSLVLELEVL